LAGEPKEGKEGTMKESRDWQAFHKWAIEEMGFEVGDEVKCIKEFEDCPLGIDTKGTKTDPGKKRRIHEVGKVRRFWGDGTLTIKYSDGETEIFPWHVLELVKKAPKHTTPPLVAEQDLREGNAVTVNFATGKVKPIREPKFKPGDRVKATGGLIGWIKESGRHYKVLWEGGDESDFYPESLLTPYPPQKLKVGDEVKLLRLPVEGEWLLPPSIVCEMTEKNLGKTGEVLRVVDLDIVHVSFPESLSFYYSTTLLEKVEKKPKYKVGDRVIVGATLGFSIDHETHGEKLGEIIEVRNDHYIVRVGCLNYGWREENLKPVPTFKEGDYARFLRPWDEKEYEGLSYYESFDKERIGRIAKVKFVDKENDVLLGSGEQNTLNIFYPSFVLKHATKEEYDKQVAQDKINALQEEIKQIKMEAGL
jgi:hypothetical protein